MTRKLCFLGSAEFVTILVGCGEELYEPDINRTQASGNERDTYMSRAVWFPATYLKDENGEPTENLDLEALFQRVSDWIEENEGRISSLSVEVVNSTILEYKNVDGAYVVVASGILIVYTLR